MRTSAPTDRGLQAIFGLVAADFSALNALIPRLLTSDVGLVEEIGRYIVESGGKRLRPLIVLLVSQVLGEQRPARIELAAIIELLHTATLLHDDVVDASALRRGRATANAQWGNASSVLVGDFIYSRAFQLMANLDRPAIVRILADATNVIAEGEVQQLSHVGNLALAEADYLKVIRGKTAMLFEAAAHTAAELAGGSSAQIAAARDFGLAFGTAYQLIDDVLDYCGEVGVIGKNVGDDLAEGKLTLPLIRAIASSAPAEADCIREAITARSRVGLADVVRIVRASGALEHARALAASYSRAATQALSQLPAHPARTALMELTEIAAQRVS